MPSPIAIAVMQAKSDARRRAAVARIASATGVGYTAPVLNARMSQDQRRMIESEAQTAFLEGIALKVDPDGKHVQSDQPQEKNMGEQNFPAQDDPQANDPNNAVPAGGNADARAKAQAMQSPVDPEVAEQVAKGGEAPPEVKEGLSSDPNGTPPKSADAEDGDGEDPEEEPTFAAKPLSFYAGKSDDEILAMDGIGPAKLKAIREAEKNAK